MRNIIIICCIQILSNVSLSKSVTKNVSNFPENDILVIVVGPVPIELQPHHSHPHSISIYQDIENHFQSLMEGLTLIRRNHLAIINPTFCQNFTTSIKRSTIKMIDNPTHLLSLNSYKNEIQQIISILPQKNKMLWVLGEWDVEILSSLKFPFIITNMGTSNFCFSERYSNVYYHYLTINHYNKCKSTAPWLNDVSFALHESLKSSEYECKTNKSNIVLLFGSPHRTKIFPGFIELAKNLPEMNFLYYGPILLSSHLPSSSNTATTTSREKKFFSEIPKNLKVTGKLSLAHKDRAELLKSAAIAILHHNVSYNRIILELLSKGTPVIQLPPLSLMTEFISSGNTGILSQNITTITQYIKSNRYSSYYQHICSQSYQFNSEVEVRRLLTATDSLLHNQKAPVFYDTLQSEITIIRTSIPQITVDSNSSNNSNRDSDNMSTAAALSSSVTPQKTTPLVVGTLTTGPKRLTSIPSLTACLQTLLAIPQLDRIYLNVPYTYGLREKSQNITVPAELLALSQSTGGRLRINRCTDYGPSTKLLPLLLLSDAELPPDSMLITFDDDRLYTKAAVSALVGYGMKKVDTVITVAAWSISILSAGGIRGKPNGPVFASRIPLGSEGTQYKKAGPVDLILGFYGVLYRKRFFQSSSELFDYSKHPDFMNHCAWVDDIWFSGHLERLRIPRFTIGKVDDSGADITPLSNTHALSLDRGVSVKQNHDNVLCAKAMSNVYGVWK